MTNYKHVLNQAISINKLMAVLGQVQKKWSPSVTSYYTVDFRLWYLWLWLTYTSMQSLLHLSTLFLDNQRTEQPLKGLIISWQWRTDCQCFHYTQLVQNLSEIHPLSTQLELVLDCTYNTGYLSSLRTVFIAVYWIHSQDNQNTVFGSLQFI